MRQQHVVIVAHRKRINDERIDVVRYNENLRQCKSDALTQNVGRCHGPVPPRVAAKRHEQLDVVLVVCKFALITSRDKV